LSGIVVAACAFLILLARQKELPPQDYSTPSLGDVRTLIGHTMLPTTLPRATIFPTG
jgi:hypothetical protein